MCAGITSIMFRQQYGEFQHVAAIAGRYTICFGNKMSTVTGKFVKIGIHRGKGELIANEILTKKHITPVQQQIVTLSDKMLQLKEKEEYLRSRMQRHQELSESTASRGFYLSMFESAVLVGVNLWQIYYLRKFFESKGYMLPTYQ